jgi:hypothetical protein
MESVEVDGEIGFLELVGFETEYRFFFKNYQRFEIINARGLYK